MKTEEAFHCERTRYHYDLKLGEGWEPYDTSQDFAYYGVWVNTGTLQVMVFAEGDEKLATCEDETEFAMLIAKMHEQHGAPPPAFKEITPEGIIITHFDEAAAHGRPLPG